MYNESGCQMMEEYPLKGCLERLTLRHTKNEAKASSSTPRRFEAQTDQPGCHVTASLL